MWITVLFSGWSLNASGQSFQRLSVSSSVTQVPVIELFTSEGCHSCPPADRWLTSLKQQQNLWTDFIPLSFHVDYWDYIGWKDKYASKQFSRRQRAYAAEFRERTVYTPGLRMLGHEWRTWRRATPLFMSNVSNELKPVDIGVLSLEIVKGNQFKASFESVEQELKGKLPSDYVFNITVLGMDIVGKINAGENRGELPSLSNLAPRYAVVAWLAHRNSLIPEQAVGSYLKRLKE